jgi:hypothetical protein
MRGNSGVKGKAVADTRRNPKLLATHRRLFSCTGQQGSGVPVTR